MIEEHRLARGEILRVCYRNYPDPVSRDLIAIHLLNAGLGILEPEVARHLAYLEEAGYIAIDTARTELADRVRVRLRRAGVDLIEDPNREDDGITLPRP